MKTLKFVGSSLESLKDFPAEARRAAGFELDAIQRGLDPSDWKPLTSVGSCAYEVRIHVLGEWRIIYVAKSSRRFTCCTHSRRKRKRPGRRILRLPVAATVK